MYHETQCPRSLCSAWVSCSDGLPGAEQPSMQAVRLRTQGGWGAQGQPCAEPAEPQGLLRASNLAAMCNTGLERVICCCCWCILKEAVGDAYTEQVLAAEVQLFILCVLVISGWLCLQLMGGLFETGYYIVLCRLCAVRGSAGQLSWELSVEPTLKWNEVRHLDRFQRRAIELWYTFKGDDLLSGYENPQHPGCYDGAHLHMFGHSMAQSSSAVCCMQEGRPGGKCLSTAEECFTHKKQHLKSIPWVICIIMRSRFALKTLLHAHIWSSLICFNSPQKILRTKPGLFADSAA